MSNSVQHKRSDLPGAIPVAADLRVGELAINLADRLMYTKDSTDAIIPLVTQGVDGLSVLSGLGAPVGGIGVDGEFYIDVTPYNIYGPKAAGVWGAPTSLIGPEGPAGVDGVDGTSVTIKGSAPWATISAIVGPAVNDMWILTEATGAPTRPDASPAQVGDGVSWNGSAWLNLGPIRGPVGPAGATGATGAPGTPGAPGADGSDGVDGTNGAMWYSGGVAPTAGLGADGDMFLLLTNGDLYQKAAGEWELIDNIMGPQGPAGTNGTNGAAGAAGSVWYTAAGAPGAGTGINGDYYLNTSNGDYYQKVSGTWTLRGNLTGPTGQGVIPGGAVGQVLTKASTTDYATQWSTPVVAPTDHGLLTGLADDDHTQYLTQARGDARYYTESEVDTKIAAVPVIPAGGTAGQVLAKINSTNYNTQWTTPVTGITDAPNDGWAYTRKSLGWATAGLFFQPIVKIGMPLSSTASKSLSVGAALLVGDAPSNASASMLELVNTTVGTGNWGGLSFQHTDETGVARHCAVIAVQKDGIWSSTLYPAHMTFWTRGTGSGNEIERLRITSAGDVGIGTTTPSKKLDVVGAGNFSVGLNVAVPANFWTTADGFFHMLGHSGSPLGWVGSAGSNRIVISSNAYRNNTSGTSYLGAGGINDNGSQIELSPDGNMWFRNGPASGINLTNRLIIGATGAVTVSNLAGSGDRMVTVSAAGLLEAASPAPVVTKGGTSSPTWYNGLGVSYHSSRFVRWTRVGDIVFVNMRLQWTALTGQSGVPATISCGTAPVPIADQTMAWGETTGIDFNSGVHHHIIGVDNSGTTLRLTLKGVQDADIAIDYSYNSVSNIGFVNINGFYFTNDP